MNTRGSQLARAAPKPFCGRHRRERIAVGVHCASGGERSTAIDAEVHDVIARFGWHPERVSVLKEDPLGNSSWLVSFGDAEPIVLRRYHHLASPTDLDYERQVLQHLGDLGWTVPQARSEILDVNGRLYGATRFVPGAPRSNETAPQRTQRGKDLAHLNLALRDLGAAVGQRPACRPQHTAVTIHERIDWPHCLDVLTQLDHRLGEWADCAVETTTRALHMTGAAELPLTVIHGDFAEWNVHYHSDELVGVVDFSDTHLDSRPYELAIARTYRSPETSAAYRSELAAHGWPLSELEEACIPLVLHAFRLDMVAWQVDRFIRTGAVDPEMIERQLERSGTPPPV
jgi:Ser/Thr protein kinase RdoA (MazF antagonist)